MEPGIEWNTIEVTTHGDDKGRYVKGIRRQGPVKRTPQPAVPARCAYCRCLLSHAIRCESCGAPR